MQDIYNEIPETNYVSRVYNIVAILQLQFVVHVVLFSILSVLHFYVSTFRSKGQRWHSG